MPATTTVSPGRARAAAFERARRSDGSSTIACLVARPISASWPVVAARLMRTRVTSTRLAGEEEFAHLSEVLVAHGPENEDVRFAGLLEMAARHCPCRVVGTVEEEGRVAADALQPARPHREAHGRDRLQVHLPGPPRGLEGADATTRLMR